MDNYFAELNAINVNEHTEKKNGLTYLSWAWAWGEVKKLHPDATYTVYENADGLFYHTDGKTCWVKTGVTVNGIEHIEYLPVMDFRNASIPADKVTSFDVNKAIQRSLTKACARHGLGLYIYAGEDLPESDTPTDKPTRPAPKNDAPKFECSICGATLKPLKRADGSEMSVREYATKCEAKNKQLVCFNCVKSHLPELYGDLSWLA